MPDSTPPAGAAATRPVAPPGYKTQSEDTSYAAEKLLFDLLRALPPWEKARRIAEDSRTLDRLALIRLRQWYPQAGERELRLRLGALRLDRMTMIKVFDWDPEREGY